MEKQLLSLLRAHVGKPLTPELASHVMLLFDAREALPIDQAGIPHGGYPGTLFACERYASVLDELRPMHQAHWKETEGYRHGLTLDPDYPQYVKANCENRYLLFTVRKDGRLVGNIGMWIAESMHTQQFVATEDTLYLAPHMRGGRLAARFIRYVEQCLVDLGIKQIKVNSKLVNSANKLMEHLGYTPVAIELMKVFGEPSG